MLVVGHIPVQEIAEHTGVRVLFLARNASAPAGSLLPKTQTVRNTAAHGPKKCNACLPLPTHVSLTVLELQADHKLSLLMHHILGRFTMRMPPMLVLQGGRRSRSMHEVAGSLPMQVSQQRGQCE